MQYKTMVLELLQQRPQIHESLREQRSLLATVETQARELKGRHEELMQVFLQMKPENESGQIPSMALELAIQELEQRLDSGSFPERTAPLSLDAAMAFLRQHSSQG